mgnify:CR=1 FL=1
MFDTLLDDVQLGRIESTWKSEEMLTRIESNWKTFEKWCDQLGDRKDIVKEMVDHFAERACMAPASSRLEFHNSFPGGFIDHSLRVVKFTVELAATFKVKIPKESLIISSLFHDWGKIGTLEDDYYLKQESDWHRKRGQFYVNNSKIKMPNAQLGLFNMNQFGVKLSEEEYMAILLNDGQYAEANRPYAMKEPKLALLVHMADRWSSQCEKGRSSLLDTDTPSF